MSKRNLLLSAVLPLVSLGFVPGAMAQSTAPAGDQVVTTTQTETDDQSATGTELVVTGSRIARPNLTSPVPITSISGEELLRSTSISIGDTLNELPQLRSTFSQSNSTRFLGTAGLNLLDLRGLGTQRTLVLVNGRRHVGSDVLVNGVSPDTNTFPTELIERSELVTGANSAVYGSDAIAGVVNFILKRSFEGFEVRAQGGISTYGDAGSYSVDGVYGKNFAGGKGNVAIDFEYAKQRQYFGANRGFLAQNNGFVTVDTDPTTAPQGSDGIPDTIFLRDIRANGFTRTGAIRFGGNAGLNAGRDGVGGFFNVPFLFLPNGDLVPQTGIRVGLGPNGSFLGGNGENFRDGDQLQLTPDLTRYNVNIIGHYEFSRPLEVFWEGKYSRTQVLGTGSNGPSFITGATLGGDPRERPRLNNPFLNDQARGVITQQLTLANGVAPAANARFTLRENLLGLGIRNEGFERQTWRGVIGARGRFNEDWNYEVSANYGTFSEGNAVRGNLNVQRFLLAIDAVRNPANGQIVCNSAINPAARIDVTGRSDSDDPVIAADGARILAADVAACIPINPFGGQYSAEQRAYLNADTDAFGKISQFDLVGSVTGDLSQLFELPGGPISFSFGAEYRRETNFYTQDPLVENGYTFYNSIPTFESPAFAVQEGFGEVRIPILKDLPGARELTISGAGRVSYYRFGGRVFSYNATVEYSPLEVLRFRAGYGRGVRAPNLGELFSPPSQNFSLYTDPCSARNLALGTANRAANCQAAGAPAGYDFVPQQSLEFRSGGNQGLTPERSNSYTLGAVFTPRAVPGLGITADYYDIRVNQAIASVAAQTILNQCYDLPTLDNQFCVLFERNLSGGNGPAGEVPFQILEGSLLQSSVNFAAFQRRGIDVEFSYNRTIENVGHLVARLNYTHVIQNDAFQDPTNPSFITRGLGALGDPNNEFAATSTLKRGKLTYGYDLRYIGRQLNVGYTSIFPLNGRPPVNTDASETNYFPNVVYHDVGLGYDATERVYVYFGINNLANKVPPLGLTGIGGGSAIFDNRGRFFFASVRLKL